MPKIVSFEGYEPSLPLKFMVSILNLVSLIGVWIRIIVSSALRKSIEEASTASLRGKKKKLQSGSSEREPWQKYWLLSLKRTFYSEGLTQLLQRLAY